MDVVPDDIRITGVIADQVGTPRNDGSAGSALYAVPLRLSRRPTPAWAQLFVRNWDHPPSFTSMHRPGIASVSGDVVWLSGTTVEEIERTHAATLKLVVAETNLEAREAEQAEAESEKARQARDEAHRARVRESADRIDFD